ncbi:MAG: TAT-variant-translocated molybdopterin oxidoreductase [Phycisphaerae bacterium]
MPSLTPGGGKTYWRSLEELADTPRFRELVEREFPSLAPDLLSAPSRRQFLKLMGASLALGGLVGCRWPRENIVPAARQPGNRTPGVPVSYATAYERAGVALGLLVTSYDGRPIKIEGNPLHDFSRGATDAHTQATILDLYDPDRAQQAARREGGRFEPVEKPAFVKAINEHFATLKSSQGAGFCVLCEASNSPALADMRRRLSEAFPQSRWYEFESISHDEEAAGTRLVFGKPYRVHLALDHAKTIVCLDADVLQSHPAAVRNARDWAKGRRADDGTMNRLYAVESTFSVTGSNADQRYAVPSAQVGAVLGRLVAALAAGGATLPGDAAGQVAALGALGDANAFEFVGDIARDLLANRGAAVIAVGPRQPAEVHALAALANEALGAVGKTVSYTELPERQSHIAALAELVGRMNDRQVDTLLILGGNPVYDAPGDLDFAAALANVKTSIRLAPAADETAALCTWFAPRSHYLETWGDARAYDGTISLVQPLIEPFWESYSPIEMLAMVLGEKLSGYELVRRTHAQLVEGDGAAWEQALHDGVIAETAWPRVQPAPKSDWLSGATAKWQTKPAAGVEIVFAPDHKLHDGRYANNGWLQELPDALTKVVWDNTAWLSPRTADRLGLKRYGDMLKIELAGRAVKLPCYILPGHGDESITLLLGYGRTAAGRVAEGAGFAVGKLRTRAAMGFAGGATVTNANEHYRIAVTQDHHVMTTAVGEHEKQRRMFEVFRDGTLAQYAADPKFGKHAVHSLPLISLWQDPVKYDGFKWGMTIDLTACTGCTACVVACQSENNIPVVGKREVERGREMHWIRIDRYFKGDPADPHVEICHQPVNCQHCENAPCETVCPVAATVHDHEGLNVMVYNRCVGTRYCSNNCPYKVRRFNWFYNHHGPYHPRSQAAGTVSPGNPKQPGFLRQKQLEDVETLRFNPEVTVRSRGVMEKCTYCVQRINHAKIEHRNAVVAGKTQSPFVPDGTITPACAQVCPTEAIVFGDLNDPNSRVRKLQDHARSYVLLEEYNNRPRTLYLTKLRNPAGATAPAKPADHGEHHG